MIALSGCTCNWSPASCAPCADDQRKRTEANTQKFIAECHDFRATPEDFIEPAHAFVPFEGPSDYTMSNVARANGASTVRR